MVIALAIAHCALLAGAGRPLRARLARRRRVVDLRGVEAHPFDILPARRRPVRRTPLAHLPVRAALHVATRLAPLASWRRAARTELDVWAVGCAVASLTMLGTPVSDASVAELMAAAGTDVATTFAALDRLRARMGVEAVPADGSETLGPAAST